MAPLTDTETWPDRVLALQESLDRKWKVRLERWFLRLTQVLTWSYVGVVLVVWLVLHLAGDRWWFASLFLFGPRWLGLLPIAALVPLTLVMRPRLLLVLAATAVLFIMGVLGFCLRWPGQAWFAESGPVITVLTCNVHGGKEAWDRFSVLLHQEAPIVVALQEVSGDATLPFPEDWHLVREGQMVLASPYPIRDVQTWRRLEPPSQWPPLLAVHAIVDCPGLPVAVCNIHLTSPQAGISEALDRNTLVSPARSDLLRQVNTLRWQESESLSAWIAQLPRTDIILGDFNMPVESRIYRRFWSGYGNAFSDIGFGVGYTRWVEMHNFEYGVRIDHILTNNGWQSVDCHVGRDVGSDHMPVVARVCWAGGN
jgi:endonuclease/exonuclease/phosphatase family metal-dependent hydrolase